MRTTHQAMYAFPNKQVMIRSTPHPGQTVLVHLLDPRQPNICCRPIETPAPGPRTMATYDTREHLRLPSSSLPKVLLLPDTVVFTAEE